VFDDDEPVEDPPAAKLEAPSSTTNAPLVLKTHCELPAVARGRARDSFAVLVRAKAPGIAAVRDAWIAVSSPHPDVRVRAIKSSGRHESCVVANGRGGLVRLGDLGAGEERRFLLFVNVPSAAAEDDDDDVTRLVRVSCAYRDAATGKTAVVIGEDAFVRRPAEVTSQEDQKPSVEVQMERFRFQATAGPFAKYAGNQRHHGFARKIMEQQHKFPATTIPLRMPNSGRC
jgi:hypothetical protein